MSAADQIPERDLRPMLAELFDGRRVVLPSSYEHAELMLRVASNYIRDQHQNTLTLLKKDYHAEKCKG